MNQGIILKHPWIVGTSGSLVRGQVKSVHAPNGKIAIFSNIKIARFAT